MICILAIGEMVMLQKLTGEIINYGFKDLGLFRIGAITYPENVTSCRMLSKIGFQKEGLLRGYIHQGNKQHDALLYSIVRTDVEDIIYNKNPLN